MPYSSFIIIIYSRHRLLTTFEHREREDIISTGLPETTIHHTHSTPHHDHRNSKEYQSRRHKQRQIRNKRPHKHKTQQGRKLRRLDISILRRHPEIAQSHRTYLSLRPTNAPRPSTSAAPSPLPTRTTSDDDVDGRISGSALPRILSTVHRSKIAIPQRILHGRNGRDIQIARRRRRALLSRRTGVRRRVAFGRTVTDGYFTNVPFFVEWVMRRCRFDLQFVDDERDASSISGRDGCG